MIIQADSIDHRLINLLKTEDIEANVHSIFHRALNLKTGKGEIISILCRENFNGPNTIIVSSIPDEIRQDEYVLCSLKGIKFAKGFFINLEKATYWAPGYKFIIPEYEELSTRYSKYLHLLGQNDLLEPMDFLIKVITPLENSSIVNSLALNFSNLIICIKECKEGRIKDIVSRIIGLGSGLTPLGDDILLGFLSVYFHIIHQEDKFNNLKEIFTKILKPAINLYKDKTNFISSCILGFALEGRFSQPIIDVLGLLYSDKNLSDDKIIKNLLNYGASSGTGICVGIFLGYYLFF